MHSLPDVLYRHHNIEKFRVYKSPSQVNNYLIWFFLQINVIITFCVNRFWILFHLWSFESGRLDFKIILRVELWPPTNCWFVAWSFIRCNVIRLFMKDSAFSTLCKVNSHAFLSLNYAFDVSRTSKIKCTYYGPHNQILKCEHEAPRTKLEKLIVSPSQ